MQKQRLLMCGLVCWMASCSVAQVETGANGDGDAARFGRLVVRMTSTWPNDRTITIEGDGRYRFEMQVLEKVPDEERLVRADEPYVAKYRLSPADMKELERLLAETQWLSSRTREDAALRDGIRYELFLTRADQKREATCYGPQSQAYADLLRFIERIDEQEWLLYQLSESSDGLSTTLHILEGQLDALLGKPHRIKPTTPALDYGRLREALERVAAAETGERQAIANRILIKIDQLGSMD